MTPYYDDGWASLYVGDALETLREIPDGAAQMCVTSPPYWGLRDYGVEGQLGLEATPEEYVERMVAVFREVRRVLRDDGTLWLNIGDSYAASGPAGGAGKQYTNVGSVDVPVRKPMGGCKPKDLVGIPWMLAFALRADGWYLRSDIIWAKPNPMPESVTDRPTKAHEMLFLLSKSPRYYYNADAIREGVSEASVVAGANGKGESLVLGQDLGLEYAGAAFSAVCVRLAATVLDLAQRQNQLGLFALDAEVRQQGTDGGASLAVVHVPVVRRAAAEAARFADGDISAKQFLSEMDRLCVALPDGDDLKKTWRLAALHVGHIDSDGDGSVAIDNAGEVGKFKFIHNQQSTILGSGSSARRGLTGDAYSPPGQSPPGQSPHGNARTDKQRGHSRRHAGFNDRWDGMTKEEQSSMGRNKRTVWTIATEPYPEAHFATFPTALVTPCVLAGCPEGGTVLEPFAGSGTTLQVAKELGRKSIGIELNADYAKLATQRLMRVPQPFPVEEPA